HDALPISLPPVRMEERAFRAITLPTGLNRAVIIKVSYDRHGGEANERTHRTFTKVTSRTPREWVRVTCQRTLGIDFLPVLLFLSSSTALEARTENVENEEELNNYGTAASYFRSILFPVSEGRKLIQTFLQALE